MKCWNSGNSLAILYSFTFLNFSISNTKYKSKLNTIKTNKRKEKGKIVIHESIAGMCTGIKTVYNYFITSVQLIVLHFRNG